MTNGEAYISKVLKEKLNGLVQAKVGALIAPAGYGKTTAAHIAVSDIPTAQQHWFTADKTNSAFDSDLYEWFLNELECIDATRASQLKELGYFNRANRYDVKNIIKKVTAKKKHYIIIDNLQYFNTEFADALISALATNESDNLRLIILSQFVTDKQKQIFKESGCVELTAQDLLLSKGDIQEYASKQAVTLSDSDIDKLLQKTDGWVVFVALYLQKAKAFLTKQNSNGNFKNNNIESRNATQNTNQNDNAIENSNNNTTQNGNNANQDGNSTQESNSAHNNNIQNGNNTKQDANATQESNSAHNNNIQDGNNANQDGNSTQESNSLNNNNIQNGNASQNNLSSDNTAQNATAQTLADEAQTQALENAAHAQAQEIANAVADIDTLLEDICWTKISKAERHFLLYFSVWQTLTYGCFLRISASDSSTIGEKEARSLMSKMPLIKFEPLINGFTMHNLLREFVVVKFNDIPAEEKNIILTAAGEFEKERGNNKKAVALFYKAKNYRQLLSCDMSGMLMENFGGVEFKEIALDIYKNCDDATLLAYPLSALRVCYALYGSAQFAEYDDFLARLQSLIECGGDNNLRGEWLLVSAFKVFPDVAKMTATYAAAEKLLTRPSKIFTCEEPYLFGCTSMWYLFYSQVGKMLSVADEIDKMIALYNSLTNGHAAGAEALYRGEAYCVQGRFDEAEILVRTAARMAEVKKNVSIIYGAALIQGIISVYRDDMIGLEEAVKYLENRAIGYEFMQGTALNKFMTETVRGYLLALLLETQDSSSWTREWTCSGTELTFTNFMVKTTQITDLILHKEYKKAIANIEATLKLDKRLISLPTENFMRVGLALCYLAIGNLWAAGQNLEKSLALAEQDKNYTFLACFRKYLFVLMMFPPMKSKHSVAIEEIKNLNLSYSIVRKKAIFDFVLSDNALLAELTERELEVAKLAAAGKRNKEIAKELFVSEYTVKNHLAMVYQKLNIDRRSRLIEMLK